MNYMKLTEEPSNQKDSNKSDYKTESKQISSDKGNLKIEEFLL